MINERVLFSLSYGLYIVSSCNKEGKINSLIANSVFQITAEPVKVAITINKESLTHQFAEESGLFCVQPLTEKADMVYIGNFGFHTGRNYDKFSKVKYHLSSNGLPIMEDNVSAYLILQVAQKIDLGTHTMFICSVIESDEQDIKMPPMTYSYYHKVLRGKTPKGATTFQKEEVKKGGKTMKYVCGVCGYVYDEAIGDPEHGIPAGTTWDKVPADWVCPVCGVGKDQFNAE